ncbi:MAG: DUF928 domain-containing protein [Cyanobacteria bacterium J06648_11]
MTVFRHLQFSKLPPCWASAAGVCLSFALVTPTAVAQLTAPSNAAAIASSHREQAATTPSSRHLDIEYVPPPAPPDRGTPRGRKAGGASRGNCQANQSLAALVPEHQGYVWGQSASARPTFWFYVPTISGSTVNVEFALQDKRDTLVYHATLALKPGPARAIDIAMPATTPPLERDRSYFWTLIIECDPARPGDTLYVRGTVRHVPPSSTLAAQLAAASAPERAAIYSQAGYWYDALTEVERLHRSDRDDPSYAAAWQHFLQQVNLDPIDVSESTNSAIVRAREQLES